MGLLELLPDVHPRLGLRYRPRAGTRASCRLADSGDCPDLALSLVNLSDAGARLAVSSPLEVGQVVEIEFLASTQMRPVRRLAAVVWARDAGHRVGILFAKPLSATELRDLGDFPPPLREA